MGILQRKANQDDKRSNRLHVCLFFAFWKKEDEFQKKKSEEFYCICFLTTEWWYNRAKTHTHTHTHARNIKQYQQNRRNLKRHIEKNCQRALNQENAQEMALSASEAAESITSHSASNSQTLFYLHLFCHLLLLSLPSFHFISFIQFIQHLFFYFSLLFVRSFLTPTWFSFAFPSRNFFVVISLHCVCLFCYVLFFRVASFDSIYLHKT